MYNARWRRQLGVVRGVLGDALRREGLGRRRRRRAGIATVGDGGGGREVSL